MIFQILSSSLHHTAEAAAKYFRSHIGVQRFDVERPIHDDLHYRPTLSGKTRDHHIMCVEVSESAYPPILDSALMGMRSIGLPVRLFVAMPTNGTDSDFQRNLRKAKEFGVGIVEVGGGQVNMVAGALSQSLAGLRPFSPKEFPPKYRQEIDRGLNTFLNGNPPQGCQTLYSEIEGLTRRIARKVDSEGSWRNVRKPIPVNLEKGAWARVVEKLRDELHPSVISCPNMNTALLNRVAGITGHRNDTGHKPKDRASLIKRDRQLRTRFETAMDILAELIIATKPFKV